MKKLFLIMMLIVGSLSFANERMDRGEERFTKEREEREKSTDEYLSRGVEEVVTEDLSEIIFITERGSRN